MHRESGLTLVEVLAVLAIIGIALAIAAVWLKPAAASLETGAVQLAGFLRQARARAIATTSAYRVSPPAADRVLVDYAATCADVTWTNDPDLFLDLPQDVTMPDTSWSVCFSARGVANNNVTVDLNHPDSGTEQVEVMLGGATRVVE